MRRTHRIASGTLAILLSLPLVLPAASAQAATPAPAVTAAVGTDVHLTLPRPTGPHAVGLSTLDLVDAHRQDPWVPSAGARRLMVSVFYPARPGNGRPAPYMTTEEAALLLQKQAPGAGIPPGTLSGTRSWARTGARPAPGRFPLIVLSPGFTLPRPTLTSLAEDLASRGYAVVLVNHTYEDSGTTFPDGRTLTCTICETLPRRGWVAVNESRAKDVSFVIDQLTGRHSPWQYHRTIDRSRIGMAGHSAGGSAAASAMAADPRVRAGADMDGTFDVPPPAAGVGARPFLLLGTESEHAPGKDTSWDQAWADLGGWKRWLTVTGAVHFNFTDLPVLASQAGFPLPGETIAAERAAAITRAYVGAFFDLQLKGIPQPLLKGPSQAYPEVTFQHP
ncbi:alpha/beta hydrolase family protein [Streptomyces sp. NBC_01431]|uniref:alpha/beta hydrolase family protein n=1 Tax=Streptomyces sp. NBC_01431 TaxID=2903863 RepID=UPI002E2FBABB|nr:alpha/beta hydrolase [Streptomyces sp. NBC_01431]